MNGLRAIIRTAAVIFSYTGIAALGLLALVVRPFSRKGNLRILIFLMGLWGRCSCRIFNIHLRVEGKGELAPGTLVVANHVGTPDIFLLAGYCPGFFVSKAEVAGWPFIGWMVRLGQTIFIDRSRRHQIQLIVSAIEARLREGFTVAVFPEAQASRGTDVLPFKPAVFEAALQAGRPVLPVSLIYHEERQPGVACWSEESFMTHILRLLKNPRLEATVYMHEALPPVGDRRALAQAAEDRIREKYLAERSRPADLAGEGGAGRGIPG